MPPVSEIPKPCDSCKHLHVDPDTRRDDYIFITCCEESQWKNNIVGKSYYPRFGTCDDFIPKEKE